MVLKKIERIEDLVACAKETFSRHFNYDPTSCSFAPGRVNLIGEHTDYNDGFVLPMALPLVTVVVGAKTNTKKCHILTLSEFVDEPKEIEFDIPSPNNALRPGKPAWANYVKGVLSNYKGSLHGFNAVITTSIPIGGGLSSSAALEVAIYTFLDVLDNGFHKHSLAEKSLACQKAEHQFTGVPCGIMDQFISFMGEKDHALLLDCRSMKLHHVPMLNSNVTILITNTNVRHQLTGSEYSKRKEQCEVACKTMGKFSLRDTTLEEILAHKYKLGDEVYRRVKHVVGEIQRTLAAATALQHENYIEFGHLMQLSHQSLRYDYEVSCPELDEVVDAALEVNGVFGSRMTGAGFGGCTVTLLEADAISRTIDNIKKKYKGEPTFYVCRPSEGSSEVKLK